MAQHTRDGLRRRSTSIVAIMLVGMLLAACGPLGSDDAVPTSTSESLSQPTEMATEVATEPSAETEVAETTVEVDSIVEETEVSDDLGTPMATAALESTAPSDVSSISTPIVDSDQPSASPEAVVSEDATPVSGTVGSGGDGTSGATPPPADGTPGSLFVPVENTPESSIPTDASPQASPVGDGSTLADLPATPATSCEPDVVPVIALADVAYTTISDVNIRSGPGADCELLAISPIGEFQSVTLVGGPVAREDEDFIWVQVTAASGVTGWIVTDAIEAAD